MITELIPQFSTLMWIFIISVAFSYFIIVSILLGIIMFGIYNLISYIDKNYEMKREEELRIKRILEEDISKITYNGIDYYWDGQLHAHWNYNSCINFALNNGYKCYIERPHEKFYIHGDASVLSNYFMLYTTEER